ncbi:hypothetical protein PF003_g9694 [Phytophthora fragariae]|nr:hypothetical protein PF003_g9694 [Phytophthora fragariae]
MWKDKFLTYIKEVDSAYERGLLEKEQGPATVRMVDFLDSHPEEPVISISKETSREEAKEMRWRLQHWNRANGGLLNLFNQSLTNMFLTGLPDNVSNMRPCDIWKELEIKYGAGDAGGVIELRRQWDRIIASNWSDLGVLFVQLKKVRNEINRKMSGLVGREIVSEHWLCTEVLAQLPSDFWGSSISLTEEWFTVEDVEVSLWCVFVDRSKKWINNLTNKRPPVAINVAKKFTGRKRTQDQAEGESSSCYYCFEPGHRKKDCPIMAKDRDPGRAGGQLFRSNIQTGSNAKKKRLMTVKKKAATKLENPKVETKDEEMTAPEAHVYDENLAKVIADADEFESKEKVSISDGDEQEDKPPTQMDMDTEVRRKFGGYLSMLKGLHATDSVWVIDTGAGHAISSDGRWFSYLTKGQPHTFEYGNGGASMSALQGTVRLNVLKPQGNDSDISIKNVAFDKKCGSNLLSTYYFATQGYWHIQAKTGEFLCCLIVITDPYLLR